MVDIQKKAGDLAAGDRLLFPKGETVTIEDIMDCDEQVLIFCDNDYCYNWMSEDKVLCQEV